MNTLYTYHAADSYVHERDDDDDSIDISASIQSAPIGCQEQFMAALGRLYRSSHACFDKRCDTLYLLP